MNADSGTLNADGSYAVLAKRIQLIEDIEAIKQLTYSYCRAVDKFDGPERDQGQRVADCFTDDGVWDGGVLGKFGGTEGLIAFFDSEFQAKMTKMGSHMATNPIITVMGDQATGNWHLLAQLTVGDEALWTAGRYENGYRRTHIGWRISEMKYTPWMWSRHLEGWAKERFMVNTGDLSGE